VGRLSPEKGLSTLIRAMAILIERRPDVSLAIIGSGPQSTDLRAMAGALGLERNITFLGGRNVTELPPFYRRAYALVLPSLSEPWGLVVNEAFQFGCPAVVSDACGCSPDLIVEGRTGFVFQAGQIASLAGALSQMLGAAGKRQDMGRECMRLIENYTPTAAAMQMMGGIRAVLSDIKPSLKRLA
jgi:glycosyltransferase involved in cell wall biosynthesis